MRLHLDLRDLLLASWPVDRAAVARALPAPLEPADVDDECLVSVVGFRCTGGRAGRVPVLPFSQLNVRVYVEHDAEPAVFFLRAFVTGAGLAGVFLGAPYRLAWLRVRGGLLSAPSQGLRLRYEVGESDASPGLLARHELGLFEERGLRAFRVQRGPAEWRGAELVEEPRLDLLTALGFDVAGGARLAYAPAASFDSEVPPRLFAAGEPKSSSSRSRR